VTTVRPKAMSDAYAKERRDWPDAWQTCPTLKHLRKHVPSLCESNWQKVFEAMGVGAVADGLESLNLYLSDIETIPIYAEEIRCLVEGFLCPLKLSCELIKDYSERLLSQASPFELMVSARSWNVCLPSIKKSEIDDSILSWDVPGDGVLEHPGTRIKFCSNELDVYRALRSTECDQAYGVSA
jgi:hypothetical protein